MSGSGLPKPGELIPHTAPMILVDEIVSWDGSICEARRTIRSNDPFLRDGTVPALLCIEYMAQTVACANGLIDIDKGRAASIGFLLGTRELELELDALNVGDVLSIRARRDFGEDKLGSFACEVWMEGQRIARAQLSVFAGSLEDIPG